MSSPQRSRALSIAFVAMLLSRLAGLALLPALLAHAPLGLVAVSPSVGHLLMTAPLCPPGAWFALALGVSIAHGVIGWAFGRAYGGGAVRWLTERGVLSEAVARPVLNALDRAAPLVLLAIPGSIVFTLSGVAGLRGRRFFPPMLLAQVLWVGLCFAVGDALTIWMARLQELALAYAVPLTLLLLPWVAFRLRGLAGKSS